MYASASARERRERERESEEERGNYVLPFPTFTLEFVYVATCIDGHTASVQRTN